jgi:hypothetical protein
MVHMVVHVHVMVAMVMPPVLAMMVSAGRGRRRRSRRVRNRLHGGLSGCRSPNERRDGDRGDGDGWKLHGIFPYEVDSVSRLLELLSRFLNGEKPRLRSSVVGGRQVIPTGLTALWNGTIPVARFLCGAALVGNSNPNA